MFCSTRGYYIIYICYIFLIRLLYFIIYVHEKWHHHLLIELNRKSWLIHTVWTQSTQFEHKKLLRATTCCRAGVCAASVQWGTPGALDRSLWRATTGCRAGVLTASAQWGTPGALGRSLWLSNHLRPFVSNHHPFPWNLNYYLSSTTCPAIKI